MTPLERRHAAIEATMARYRGRPFAWGRVDCAKMAAFHLKKLGFPISISKAGSYSSAIGAKRAIGRMGYDNLTDLLDGLGLTRIPYSRLMLGDIVLAEGHGGVDALGIYASNGHVLGFHEDMLDHGLVTVDLTPVAAWSVL
ncbi:DUF6950 family protein [Sphingobium sp. YG1]|uniref:DUF6950 family protein n=1 Tax=Sphingobium sp. YG1 TaxID=2082188 RepID=UPI000DBB5E37|nr:hypothetical protein [Sphingobium sp. YG1]BBD01832.1 hypothetical protein YGS_C1P3087 [Sphingobium sp. YG1]